MRQFVLAAAVSLALTPASIAWAADPPAAQCKDAAGRTVACPTDSRQGSGKNSDVTVAAPFSRPKPDPGDLKRSPDATIPPMASALCQDGTYSRATQRAVACELHGGVAQWVR
jgi:hypothetical protein